MAPEHTPRSLAFVPGALLLAVPLAVDPAAQLFFLPIKWLLVCTLVPLGLAVAGGARRLRWPAARWWAAWLAVLGLATVAGVAPLLSTFGAPQRNVGLLAWAVAAGAFVLGATVGDDRAVLRWVARSCLLAAGLVGIGAVLDRLGVDVFGLGDLNGITRARSTWGSATFAAGYLVLVGPLAAVHLRSDDARWRTTGAVASAAAFVGLLLTGTRGAFLGALAAAAVVAWPDRRRLAAYGPRRLVPFAAGVAAVLLGLAALTSPTLGRSTTTGRLDLWQVSAVAVLERPLLGAGPDAQRIVLPAVIDDDFERDHSSGELHDRAHDLVLDTLLTTGLVGVATLGALLVAIGRLLVPAARSGAVGRALVAGLVGYVVHLLTAFGEATLDPLAWLLAGVAVAVGRGADPGRTEPERSPRQVPRLAVSGAFVLIALGGAAWAGAELWVDHQLRHALDQRVAGQGIVALEALDGAAREAPGRWDVLQVRARLAEELRNSGFEIDLAATSLADLDAALDVAPGDPDLLIDRASALASAGDLEGARAAYDAVLAGPYPSSSRVWLGLGIVAAQEGDDEEAVRAWTRAADLAPGDPRAFINLGLLAERAGDDVGALAAYRRALEADPTSTLARAAIDRLSER